MLAPPDGDAVATVASVVDLDTPAVAGMADLHRVTLAADVDYARFPQEPDDATTVVFGNLVDADQGESAPEVAVGSGDNRSAFQTFKLPKAPLTYHQAPSQTPPQAPGLEVAVAGRTWTRVESLFGQDARRPGLHRPRGQRRELLGAVRRRRPRCAAAQRRGQRDRALSDRGGCPRAAEARHPRAGGAARAAGGRAASGRRLRWRRARGGRRGPGRRARPGTEPGPAGRSRRLRERGARQRRRGPRVGGVGSRRRSPDSDGDRADGGRARGRARGGGGRPARGGT